MESIWALWPWFHTIGRILFGMLFLASGMNHLTQLDNTAAYAASKGVPAPKPAALVSGLMILVGGILLVLGWHRFIGAGLIVIFLLPTAFIMHAFWKETDPMARQNEMAHFFKDLALAGAALYMAWDAGAHWPMSLGG